MSTNRVFSGSLCPNDLPIGPYSTLEDHIVFQFIIRKCLFWKGIHRHEFRSLVVSLNPCSIVWSSRGHARSNHQNGRMTVASDAAPDRGKQCDKSQAETSGRNLVQLWARVFSSHVAKMNSGSSKERKRGSAPCPSTLEHAWCIVLSSSGEPCQLQASELLLQNCCKR